LQTAEFQEFYQSENKISPRDLKRNFDYGFAGYNFAAEFQISSAAYFHCTLWKSASRRQNSAMRFLLGILR